MAYEPNEWSCGDTVTAEKLNAMERGISDMNADYVPTEWVCGDVITAEKLNHMEQGIANGCEGGSSDFSTAQVTVVNNLPHDIPATVLGAFIVNDALTRAAEFEHGTSTKECVLYKNLADVYPDDYDTVSVSGNATIDEYNIVFITGDCTITISDIGNDII